MHQCLNIVEVQQTIFKDAYYQPWGRTTVARLARTCRAFNNTALDVLWTRLEGFLCLIYALPQDLWKIDSTRKKMTFQRSMSLKDWKIFFGYSSRVRSLSHGRFGKWAGHMELGDDVIFSLSTPPSYGPLIPRLKMLCWDGSNRHHAPLLRLLLSPSLDSISLTSCSLRFPEVSILSSIGTVCPSLKGLSITFPSPDTLDADCEKIISESLLHLQSLESLVCPRLSEVAIIHLSRLPSLVSLSFRLQLDFQAEKVQPHLAPPAFAFASIQSLTLHASTLSALTSLLTLLHFQPGKVSFIVANTPTLDALDLFFLALASSCDPKQLSSISLTTPDVRLLDTRRVTLSTFQPLFAFPNINSFEFNMTRNMALDDDAINTLTNWWPKLTLLSINAISGWGIRSRITPKGLIKLLSCCTELTTIALSVDFSDIDWPHVPCSRPGNGVTNDKCLVADFGKSMIRFPPTIAAFLSDICPKLERVESSWSCGLVGQGMGVEDVCVYQERWEEVNRLLPVFVAVRSQCMTWAQK